MIKKNPGVRIDVEMMGQMTGGLSKAHYRLLSYLRSRGENRLDIETAFEAAGARRSRYYPSDALKAFASAYTVMQRYRHITRPPDAERRPDGSYDLVFDWGDPVELPARADTLFRDLLEIGIRPAEAESMIQQDPRKVGALIQALRIGAIDARQNAAGYIVTLFRDKSWSLPVPEDLSEEQLELLRTDRSRLPLGVAPLIERIRDTRLKPKERKVLLQTLRRAHGVTSKSLGFNPNGTPVS